VRGSKNSKRERLIERRETDFDKVLIDRHMLNVGRLVPESKKNIVNLTSSKHFGDRRGWIFKSRLYGMGARKS